VVRKRNLTQAGEKQSFDVNTDGHTFDFHAVIPGVTGLLWLSSKLTVDDGLIFGGRPGTNEETFLFENATVDEPAGCTIETGGVEKPVAGTIAFHPVKTEIVEGQNGEVLMRLVPKEGTVFTTIKFLGAACGLAGAEAQLEGGILGLPLPQRTAVLRQNIVFPSVEQTFLLASGGARKTTGLVFEGEPVTFTGLTLLLLKSDLVFGPF
jgi:hypothetical protein